MAKDYKRVLGARKLQKIGGSHSLVLPIEFIQNNDLEKGSMLELFEIDKKNILIKVQR